MKTAPDNIDIWQQYRHSAAKINADGLETVFPPDIRPRIHKIAVCNLSGLLCALEDAFFDDELRIEPPEEMDRVAVVLDVVRHAMEEGTLREFSDYVMDYRRRTS